MVDVDDSFPDQHHILDVGSEVLDRENGVLVLQDNQRLPDSVQGVLRSGALFYIENPWCLLLLPLLHDVLALHLLDHPHG